MIGYLEGAVRGDVVITSSGVGYRVDTPNNLPDGEQVTLWVETVVRDNDIRLYGFADITGRDTFRALCKASGIGPAAALSVLRELSPSRLAVAIASGDIDAVSRARGVGRKAAQSIVTNVKLPASLLAAADPVAASVSAHTELVAALTGLGFGAAVAEHAATRAVADLPDGDEPAVLARALQLAASTVAAS